MLSTPTQKVVVTGGPCAGKSTVLGHMQARFQDQIQLVNEVATYVLEHIMKVPGKEIGWSPEWQAAFQQEVFNYQLAAEATAELQARTDSKRIILCDRGTLDGAAYTPGGVETFCELAGLTASEELSRYTAVIHLESVATSAPHLYGTTGNTNRFERLERAQELEHTTRAAWNSHPRWIFIPGSQTVEEKTDQVQEIIRALLKGE